MAESRGTAEPDPGAKKEHSRRFGHDRDAEIVRRHRVGAEGHVHVVGGVDAVGIGGASLGLWLTDLRQRARVVVPFSAGVLLGVAIFGLLPELAKDAGLGIIFKKE